MMFEIFEFLNNYGSDLLVGHLNISKSVAEQEVSQQQFKSQLFRVKSQLHFPKS